jgi:hypothetical protein
MQLLGLTDQKRIAEVIDYLVEIHQKDNTVEDVMERFGLSPEEYRMCCNLAMPALRQGNIKGRFTAVSRMNKAMRRDIKALYKEVQSDPEKAAAGVEMLWGTYCTHTCGAVYGTASARETAQCAVSSELGPVRPEEGTGMRD